ncbi:hypothetical protein KKH27_13770 [bacterium]|nr:hypothetical protein [bacterium]MBU1984578.1 hypothetical protein [bacterium]
MTRQETATFLRQYAVLLELLGEDSFRARAFDNAARSLEAQSDSLESLIAGDRLVTIQGIGKGVAAAITEISTRGTFADLDRAREQVPPGVLELLRVEGLGPKKAQTLWRQASITSLAALEIALEAGVVATLPGFGTKTAEKLRSGLAFIKSVSGRHWRHHAERTAQACREAIENIAGVDEVFFGGSYLRGLETVGDLDIVVIAQFDRHEDIRQSILRLPGLTWEETGRLLKGWTASRFPIELSVVSPRDAVIRKLLVTGSHEHVQALRVVAEKRGYDLERIEAASEEDLYARLGLEYVPPPLRESAKTVMSAGSKVFSDPVKASDIRGILHCHTTYSDGHHTLRELAEAASGRGYEYLGIADHSQSAAYARGLTPERVREQWREIDELNRELAPFRILKGTEVDVLADGSLDFADELLAGFDFVVASVHSGFNMTEAEATRRICNALANPQVDILGHPTGRLLLERNGYPVNHEEVLQCAARNGKAVELNCNPHRLDLDWRWLSRCEELGVPVPLCPDAHHVDGLWDIRFGIEVAAKGPLTAMNCLSVWDVNRFVSWCKDHE